jgi:hypothetical protein
MGKNTMTTMTIRISSDLKQSLENAAALNGESVSHAIRSCINNYIANSCHSKDGSMYDIPEENLQRSYLGVMHPRVQSSIKEIFNNMRIDILMLAA